MQRLRQGGILRNDLNDFNLESLRLAIPQRSIVPIYFRSFVFHVSSSKHHVSISAVAQKVNLGNLGVRNNEAERTRALPFLGVL